MDAITSSGNYLGTDRLGRPLTDAESKQLERVLRQHDFVGASVVALRFAFKLTRGRGSARDLVGRANLRFVRQGWDPNVVPLVKCLCRFVWSEHTNARSETAAARRAEAVFTREREIHGEQLPAAATHGEPDRGPREPIVASHEQALLRLEQERHEEAQQVRMRADLDKLRGYFQAHDDQVNLVYLERAMQGDETVAQMAAATGRDADEFYQAQKRRKRAVQRLLMKNDGTPDEGGHND